MVPLVRRRRVERCLSFPRDAWTGAVSRVIAETGGVLAWGAMSAIYQRARPTSFGEVVGQDHVKDVLLAALRRNRTTHAYLFSGPRGVGKTTSARLLAMALNCEAGEGVERPCGTCDGCRMVREGNHPDVIELDAASNNSVEDVRELREKTSLSSMRGGSRVWILDEAHMLSRPAANALLKTLEEPPPGLVFVLATTEPEKLPPTVLSRCQHFRFRRLSESEILGKLERLCREAGVEAQPEALRLVARAADGAMRDAESLLERLLTPGAAIDLAAAEDALGLPPVHRIQKLATALATSDLAALLSQAESLYRDGFAPRSLAENLGIVLRDSLKAEVAGGQGGVGGEGGSSGEQPNGFILPLARGELLRLIHVLDDEHDRFIRRDDLYSLEVALIKGVNSLAAPAGRSAGEREAEVAKGGVTREGGAAAASTAPGVANDRAAASGGMLNDARAGKDDAPAAVASPGEVARDELPSFEPTGRGQQPAAKRPIAADRAESGKGDGEAAQGSGQVGKLDWHAVRAAAGPQLKAFLMPARESVDGERVVIRYAETHRFHFNELKKRQDELARLIEEVGGPGYRLRIEGPGESAAKKP